MKNSKISSQLTSKRIFIFLFIFLSVLISIAGYWFYSTEAGRIKGQKEGTLSAIATLKTMQIKNWYLDELVDVEVISANPALLEKTAKYLQTSSRSDKKNLTDFLKQFKMEHDYADFV